MRSLLKIFVSALAGVLFVPQFELLRMTPRNRRRPPRGCRTCFPWRSMAPTTKNLAKLRTSLSILPSGQISYARVVFRRDPGHGRQVFRRAVE